MLRSSSPPRSWRDRNDGRRRESDGKTPRGGRRRYLLLLRRRLRFRSDAPCATRSGGSAVKSSVAGSRQRPTRIGSWFGRRGVGNYDARDDASGRASTTRRLESMRRASERAPMTNARYSLELYGDDTTARGRAVSCASESIVYCTLVSRTLRISRSQPDRPTVPDRIAVISFQFSMIRLVVYFVRG